MEAAVRWSPRSTEDYKRFLLVDVAGNSLTLYRVDALNKQNIQYSPVAHRDKVPNFTAFDWAKTDDSLVALGLSSGEASLIKIEAGVPQAEPLRNFTIKTQRKCNTITFSSNNLLAIGLDKVRHDNCLTIYDINAKDPVSKLCVAELVSSVRFFPTHPHELLAGVAKATIRLYDLRGESASTRALYSLYFDLPCSVYTSLFLHFLHSIGPSSLSHFHLSSTKNMYHFSDTEPAPRFLSKHCRCWYFW